MLNSERERDTKLKLQKYRQTFTDIQKYLDIIVYVKCIKISQAHARKQKQSYLIEPTSNPANKIKINLLNNLKIVKFSLV